MAEGGSAPRRAASGLLALPPPYRAWLALSNDPDCTSMASWNELHRLIWGELALPFADSFFLTNHNERWPDQVNLRDHPEVALAHPHDTMHTWGDYTLSRGPRFHRDQAIAGLERLRALGITPRVWVDHSDFTGNVLHRTTGPVVPERRDASGHRFENPDYTLDLVHDAGVRYLWDGALIGLIGQDRPVGRTEWYANQHRSLARARALAALHALGAPLWRRVRAQLFSHAANVNAQYFPMRFSDGLSFCCFRRHGSWTLADIDGLGQVIAPERIDRLVLVEGTAIVYTHLGKRRADRMEDPRHVPDATAAALAALAARYRRSEIMLSSVSRLLDYLVLRDSARVSPGSIDFRPDGIRFASIGDADLAGQSFGVESATSAPRVSCEGRTLNGQIERLEGATWRIAL